MKEQYCGYTIDIVPDSDVESPRTAWDNFGTMVIFHSRYDLGDKHKFSEPAEVREYVKNNKCVYLPVYMYDHSGITLSWKPFSCPWDSGQVGYIFVEHEKIVKEYGNASQTNLVNALRRLQGEVETYDRYVTGSFCGYVVEKDGETIDSCWGYESEKYAKEDARSVVDGYIKEALQKKVKKLKSYIRNNVPLDKRQEVTA